jgi:hypothetical protein
MSKKTLALDAAVAGMEIADQLVDRNGNTLLPSGAVLTEASISSLQRRGVEEITIVCAEEPGPDVQARKEQARKRLQKIFRRAYQEELGHALLNYVCLYRTGERYE